MVDYINKHIKKLYAILDQYEENPSEDLLEKAKNEFNLACEDGCDSEVPAGLLENLIISSEKSV